MKRVYFFLLLLLAACAPTRPPQVRTWPTRISPADSLRLAETHRIFDGYPPVPVMDLEAAPDSITTVVAEYWYLTAKDWLQKVKKLPKARPK